MTENHQVPPQFDDTAQTRGDAQQDPFAVFLEHQKKAIEETGKALDALLPPGFKEHSNEARREFARGWKVLVDAAVVELEKASKEVDKAFKRTRQDAPDTEEVIVERPSSTGKTKVKVQVD
jgi:hypothetical protein